MMPTVGRIATRVLFWTATTVTKAPALIGIGSLGLIDSSTASPVTAVYS